MLPSQSAAPSHHLYLIGMMGAGKSTIGKLLAARLGRPFVDMDKRIVERVGVSIPTIFDIEGEAGFRVRETAALLEMQSEAAAVVATGGGAVLRPENQQAMRQSGLILYLTATPDELWRRIRRDRSRPLLQQADPETKLRALLAEREPIYQALAHLTVSSDSQGAPRLADRIIALIQSQSV